MADVLLIVSSAASGTEDQIRVQMESNGHTVTKIESTADPTVHFPNVDVVHITGSVAPGNLSTHHADLVAFTGGVIAEGRSGTSLNMWKPLNLWDGAEAATNRDSATIEATGHELAAGFTGNVVIYDAVISAQFGDKNTGMFGTGVQHIMHLLNSPERAALFAYELASSLVTGTAAGRRVATFQYTSTQGNPTADSWTLMDAAVVWAAGGSTGLDVPANFMFAKADGVRQIDAAADAVAEASSYELEWQEWGGSSWQAMGVESNATPSFTLSDANGVNWDTLYRGRMRALP